jgi:cytochrome c oxidase cbb3-type subunit 1
MSSYNPQLATPGASLDRSRVLAFAAWHSLAWLVIANAIGVLIASLLLLPGLNHLLGEWTYGRWIPVHVNAQLYGWCSLPLVAFLFKVYGADREPAAQWCRSVLWVWSSALAIGALTWLTGHSRGKLFLDWTGYSRILFPLALVTLWLVLAFSLVSGWKFPANSAVAARSTMFIGLALLLAVPVLIYIAASPTLYPPINPDTGGPTGASQLESTLVIIAILLLLPLGLTRRRTGRSWQITTAWTIFAAEFLLCLALGRADVSHHRPIQYISLGSLLVWLPLTTVYYSAFEWHPNTSRWRIAFLCWWSALVPTG